MLVKRLVPARARSRGFTLIELLVVALIVSVMMAIAVPSFVSFISNYRATTAINDFLQGIAQTRSEALKRGRRVTMAPIGADWRSGWTIFIDSTPGNQSWDAGEELLFRHDALPSSISIAGPGGTGVPFLDGATSRSYVGFDGTGYPRRANGSTYPAGGMGIEMRNVMGGNSSRRTLCLATMGRPRIVKDVSEACSAG